MSDADQPCTEPKQKAAVHHEPHPTRTERREAFAQAVRSSKSMDDIIAVFDEFTQKPSKPCS